MALCSQSADALAVLIEAALLIEASSQTEPTLCWRIDVLRDITGDGSWIKVTSTVDDIDKEVAITHELTIDKDGDLNQWFVAELSTPEAPQGRQVMSLAPKLIATRTVDLLLGKLDKKAA